MRARLLVPIALSMMLACGPPVPAPATGARPPMDAAAAEAEFLARLNEWRRGRRLATVQLDGRLVAAARRHAADMTRSVGCSHTGPGGTTFSERASAEGYRAPSGEVLACGIDDPARALDLLLRSRPHRRILSDPDQRDAGVAVSGGMWAVVFGRGGG